MRHAVIGLLAFLTACSINHRSDEVACIVDSDCGGGGKTCHNNQCIGEDGGKPDPDAKPGKDTPLPPDAFVCPQPCTSCDSSTMTCTVDCSITATGCAGQVVCPPGFNCDIKCNVDNACRNGVNCTAGLDCGVECSGGSSCRGVVCGTGICKVGCGGFDSCRNVNCGQACACDVECGQLARCEAITCKLGTNGFSCRPQFGNGCTSAPDSCNTCQ